MIVVIADDLTGAAEIGGIGLRYNLTVDIVMEANFSSNADLVIFNTNSRSKSEEEAVALTQAFCLALKKHKPAFVFKKTDSVLRGYIVTEIETQLKELALKQALLIPANPSIGRVIENGIYYVNGQAIDQTSFANDPEFPIKTAVVKDILKNGQLAIAVKKYTDNLPNEAIIVGEVSTESDLDNWARKVSANTLIAGSSVFFNAIMKQKFTNFKENYKEYISVNFPILYVSGTKFNTSNNLIESLALNKQPVSYMPEILLNAKEFNTDAIHIWIQEINQLIKKNSKAFIAINQKEALGKQLDAEFLRKIMAKVVAEVLNTIEVKELIIEGGATASEILHQLNIDKLSVAQELSLGITRNFTPKKGLTITVKPGSYSWEKRIWEK